MQPLRIGIVGCGNISGIYLKNLTSYPDTRVVACADLDLDRAKAAADQYGVPKACTTEELLNDPDIELVLNLTVPKAHFQVAKALLSAGKHVYNEKPLTVTRPDALELLRLAEERGLKIGCAPDTFLGAGLQTCRKLIDDGAIGEPIGANAFMMCHGHESWHPSPEFYYEVGGGPMLDMGPYYLTALCTLIGPIRRVSGSARATFPTRTITSEPKRGKVVTVETPTHIVGVLDFQNGAIGQITTSFDVWGHHMPCIEIYGTEGSMLVPDPNGFGGPVQVWTRQQPQWTEVPLTHAYAENSRGLGVLDMAYAIRNARPHRASGALAYHVLDAMLAVTDASTEGKALVLDSGVERPAALPAETPQGRLLE